MASYRADSPKRVNRQNNNPYGRSGDNDKYSMAMQINDERNYAGASNFDSDYADVSNFDSDYIYTSEQKSRQSNSSNYSCNSPRRRATYNPRNSVTHVISEKPVVVSFLDANAWWQRNFGQKVMVPIEQFQVTFMTLYPQVDKSGGTFVTKVMKYIPVMFITWMIQKNISKQEFDRFVNSYSYNGNLLAAINSAAVQYFTPGGFSYRWWAGLTTEEEVAKLTINGQNCFVRFCHLPYTVDGRDLNIENSTTITITFNDNYDNQLVKYIVVMEKGTIMFCKNQGDELNFVQIQDSRKISSIKDFIDEYKGLYRSVINVNIDNLENFVDTLEESTKKQCNSYAD